MNTYREAFAHLRGRLISSQRGYERLCFHESVTDRVHVMLMAIKEHTCISWHKSDGSGFNFYQVVQGRLYLHTRNREDWSDHSTYCLDHTTLPLTIERNNWRMLSNYDDDVCFYIETCSGFNGSHSTHWNYQYSLLSKEIRV